MKNNPQRIAKSGKEKTQNAVRKSTAFWAGPKIKRDKEPTNPIPMPLPLRAIDVL